jgi:hypothetical protein
MLFWLMKLKEQLKTHILLLIGEDEDGFNLQNQRESEKELN